VPRNVDPDIHGLDNVYVFNVDDLEQQVAEGLKARHAELSSAENIVGQELAAFEAWARSLDVQPTLVGLRARTRGVLVAELDRTLGGRLKHLQEGDRAALQQMVESAVNKLLHAPTTRLKAAAASNAAAEYAHALKHLFDLPEEAEQAAAKEKDAQNDKEKRAEPGRASAGGSPPGDDGGRMH